MMDVNEMETSFTRVADSKYVVYTLNDDLCTFEVSESQGFKISLHARIHQLTWKQRMARILHMKVGSL